MFLQLNYEMKIKYINYKKWQIKRSFNENLKIKAIE